MIHIKTLFFCFFLLLTGAASAQNIGQAQRWIKIGNTLRETKQFKEAGSYLEQGLAIAQKLNDRYWQAAAYENLGLLYRDMNDGTSASRYFKKSLDLYQALNMSLSIKAIQQLYNGTSNKNDIYGGIEIGAKGVKATVIGVKLNTAGNYSFEQVYNTSINTSPAQCASFKETAKAVRTLLDTLMNRKIPVEKIFIVGSSGLKTELDKPECGKTQEFLNAVKAETQGVYKQDIFFIDACQEAELGMKGTISSTEWGNCAMIDIGSGNVKGGYYQDNEFQCIDFQSILPFVKYVQSQNKSTAFAQAAQEVYNNDFGPNIVKPEIDRKPLFQSRNKVYIIGGIVYAMTTYLHPEQFNRDEVSFTFSDVEQFKKRAIEDYNNLIKPDISGIDDEALYKSVKKAIDKPIFNQEELIAGAILLEGIMSEVKKTNLSKQFVFNRNGYIGWISGYIINLIMKDYQQTNEQ